MSAEEVGVLGVATFRGFGHSRGSPHYEVSVDPTMQRMLSELNAETEAKRLRTETAMHTPEGRKKAAEAKLAEKKRKESNWLSRVIIDRGNGWKPIWGTAEDQELRIYTLVDGGEHRFWGTKPLGMGIDDFWYKYDPEVKRYEDRQQETPVNPNAPTGPLIGEPPRSLPSANKVAAKSRTGQRTSEINPTHRTKKSTTKSPKVNKSTRRSLANKVDAGHPELEGQIRDVKVITSAHANSRTTRAKTAGIASSAQQEGPTEDGGSPPSKLPRGRPTAKAKAAPKDDTSHPKRPRGRPATKGMTTESPPKQKSIPAVKGNARVTKSSQAERRPSAPSTHKMRTRREGPAELLQLT